MAWATDRRQRRIGRGLLAGLEQDFPPGLIHRHRSFDDRDDGSSHAGRHREDGPLHRRNRITRQHAQVPAALLRRLDDDVAALEVNRLAAPGGGHEQLRSLVDIHRRSVGEAQRRVRARARADRFLLADGGAGCERASGQPVAARRRRRRPSPAGRRAPSSRRWCRGRDTGTRAPARPRRRGLPSAASAKRIAAAWRSPAVRLSARPARRGTRRSG